MFTTEAPEIVRRLIATMSPTATVVVQPVSVELDAVVPLETAGVAEAVTVLATVGKDPTTTFHTSTVAVPASTVTRQDVILPENSAGGR